MIPISHYFQLGALKNHVMLDSLSPFAGLSFCTFIALFTPHRVCLCVQYRNVGFVKIGFVIISKPRGHLFGTPPPGLELSYRCRRPSVHFDSYATRNANSLGLHGLYKPRDQKSYTRGRGYLRDAMYTTREISRQTNQRKWEDRLGEIYDRKNHSNFFKSKTSTTRPGGECGQ